MNEELDYDYPVTPLTPDDVIAIVSLLRKETEENILMIEANGNGAHVQTGECFSPDAGEGHCFDFERTATGWKITTAGQWMV